MIATCTALGAADSPRIERRKPLTANIGVVSVGLDTYWKQCPGLYEDMLKKAAVFEKRVESHQAKVTSFGISDNPGKAASLIPAMKAADLDLLFVDMVTYATSSTFAPFVRELKCPIVLVALQPDSKLDYEHATIYRQLLNDDLCSVPEFTGVAIRYGRPVADVVIGQLEGDAKADEEVRQWCAVAHVLHDLRRARIGLMGHVLEAMYDMQVDPTAVSRTFGCHVALCEPDEIMPFYREPVAADVVAMKKRILGFFDTPDPVSDPWTQKLTDKDLDVAAKAACALEKFIAKRNLDGFAYYYEGEAGSPTRELVTNFIVGNSLLTSAGFPMCGEFDLKNCVAMMIFDRLDIGGSFAEFHPIDFERGTVLVGHDGPHHLNIASRKPVLRSLKKYHGKPGSGAGVEFNIKEGPITMMSIGLKADGAFKFVVAEGESLAGPIPPTGNTNTHGKFPPDVRTFLRNWSMEGPTHHFALGIGHHAAELKKLGKALGIETVVVTEGLGK
ncbi:MAG: L-fucose/L-arabinose isomerase family protein [Kiritimatiellae bacterium]|nr:L-fucose/L-arabinose isomerase family protein [Kiritimatiellia bacterium]